MQTAAKTTPPSTLVPTPNPKLTAVGRLILAAISRKRRALTLVEIQRFVHCCHSTAFQLTRDLVAAGLLVTYPSEHGVPRTFALNRSSTNPLRAAGLPEVAA